MVAVMVRGVVHRRDNLLSCRSYAVFGGLSQTRRSSSGAAEESLRQLAADYGVAHTTLLHYFRRPDVVLELPAPRGERRRPAVPAPQPRRNRAERLVADVDFMQLGSRREVGARAGHEVVDDVKRIPARESASTRCDPMDPAPPVTIARIHHQS